MNNVNALIKRPVLESEYHGMIGHIIAVIALAGCVARSSVNCGIEYAGWSFAITLTSKWAWWRHRSPASILFTHQFVQAQIKENIKAPRHWPLWEEFTGAGEFPAQKASNAENVSICWRHHGFHKNIFPLPRTSQVLKFTENVKISQASGINQYKSLWIYTVFVQFPCMLFKQH